RRGRFCRFLREAVSEIRAADRDVPDLRTAWVPQLRDGHAVLDPRKAVSEGLARPRIEAAGVHTPDGPAAVHRTPSEPRRQRLLSLTFRRSRRADDGRCWRVDDDID